MPRPACKLDVAFRVYLGHTELSSQRGVILKKIVVGSVLKILMGRAGFMPGPACKLLEAGHGHRQCRLLLAVFCAAFFCIYTKREFDLHFFECTGNRADGKTATTQI